MRQQTQQDDSKTFHEVAELSITRNVSLCRSQLEQIDTSEAGTTTASPRKRLGGRKPINKIIIDGVPWALHKKMQRSNSDIFVNQVTKENRTRDGLNKRISKLENSIIKVEGYTMIINNSNLEQENDQVDVLYMPREREKFETTVVEAKLKLGRMYAILNYMASNSFTPKSKSNDECQYRLVICSGSKFRAYINEYKKYLNILLELNIIKIHATYIIGWQKTSYRIYHDKLEVGSDVSGGEYTREIQRAEERISKYTSTKKVTDPIPTEKYEIIHDRISKYFYGGKGINDKIAIRSALKDLEKRIKKGYKLTITIEEIQELRDLSNTDADRHYYAHFKSIEEKAKTESMMWEEQPESSFEDNDPYEDTRNEVEYWNDQMLLQNE